MKAAYKAGFVFLIQFFLVYNFCFSQLNEQYVVSNTVTTCLNVRESPNTSAESITCLEPGTVVTVIDAVPFWRKIKFDDNKTGWAAKKFLTPVTVSADTNLDSIPSNAYLTVSFVDVGQGDAIWIQTYDDGIAGNGKFEGYSIIIDGGPYSSDDSNPLLGYMEKQGYHGADIEALIVTHPHADHFSGAETIARHFNIDNYYDPGYPSDLSSYKSFISEIKGTNGKPPRAKHIHIGEANFGQINWGKELKVDVLYAWNGDPQHTLGTGNTLINNSSVVLRLQYGNCVFLFMGDAEGKDREDNASTAHYVEQILLQTVPDKLKATVLKIAHHGSETSGTIPFINAVDPDIVVVESGRKSFGGTYLPDSTTLQRYCAHNPNVKIYSTEENDALTAKKDRDAVDGDNIIIKTNGKGKPQVQVFDHGNIFTGNFCGN